MKIAGRIATLLVTDDGGNVLESLGIGLHSPNKLVIVIKESEDLGLWLRIAREGREHDVLLFWQYILGIDMVEELGKTTGLKG